jgi:hypothetical protein
LCATSIACSSRGQVQGGAPTPVAFSSDWSFNSLKLRNRKDPNGPPKRA